MPFFLVTSLCDEGMGDRSFRVVEATSRIALAEDMLREPERWSEFLERSHLSWEISRRWWSPEEWLAKVDASTVDGDSRYQLAIREIVEVQICGTFQKFDVGRLQGQTSKDQMI